MKLQFFWLYTQLVLITKEKENVDQEGRSFLMAIPRTISVWDIDVQF